MPLRAALADAVTFGTAVVLVLLPLFVCVPWPVVAQRSQRVLLTDPISLSGFQAAYHVTGIWPVFLHNVQSALSMFTESADLAVHVHSPGGLLDGATLIAVIGGSFVAIAQGEPDALLLVGWIAFTLLAGVAFTDNPRASYRLAAAMPAIFMVAAVGVERALLQLGPRRRLYRFTVCPLLIGIIALWIATDNYRLFIAVAAPEHYLSAALRLVGSHCDGRRFYFVGDWLAQNAPLSQEPTDWVEVFCSDHRALQLEQIPKGLDADRPATFLLVPWADPRFSEILRSCYPTAEATPHFGRDGHLLFTSVDVSAGNLRIDGGCAETLVGSESACVIPAVDAAKMGGPEKDAM